MWEKIKKFFKWIADHTGISWIARKISSGWKWLFGGKASATQKNTSQQKRPSDNERQESAQAQSKSTTTPKTSAPSRPTPAAESETPGGDSSVNQSIPLLYEPLKTTTQEPAQPTLDEKSQKSVVNERKEGELKLDTALNAISLSLKQALVVQDYKSHNVNINELLTELLIYIKCGKDEYRVVGSTFGNPSSIFNVLIVSIVKKNENGEYLDSNIKYLVNKDVKEVLGLKDDVTTVKVDSISNKPFEGTALEQPKPNGTSHNVTQQVVNNEGVTTESEKFFDAEDDGVTQPSSTTTDMVVEQADTPNQPIPSAVPNEPQETLVNAHEEKGKPNNAEEVQPEVSNKEVAAEEHASSSTTAGQQSDLNAGTKEIDNLQASAGDSTPSSGSSSFDIVSSQATTPDELQEPDEDKELARQSEADQKGHVETKNGQLELVVSQDQESFVKESKNSGNGEECLVYIACDTGNFRITCVHQDNVFHINSVKLQSPEESAVTGELEEMQKLLGINDKEGKVIIHDISSIPASPESEVPANDSIRTSVSPDSTTKVVNSDQKHSAGSDQGKQQVAGNHSQ